MKLPPAGFSLRARINHSGGDFVITNVYLDSISGGLRYEMPASFFKPNELYKAELVYLKASSLSPKPDAPCEVMPQFDEKKTPVNPPKGQGEPEYPLCEIYFRTSRYATFFEKWNGKVLTTAPGKTEGTIVLDEPMDSMELAAPAIGYITFKAHSNQALEQATKTGTAYLQGLTSLSKRYSDDKEMKENWIKNGSPGEETVVFRDISIGDEDFFSSGFPRKNDWQTIEYFRQNSALTDEIETLQKEMTLEQFQLSQKVIPPAITARDFEKGKLPSVKNAETTFKISSSQVAFQRYKAILSGAIEASIEMTAKEALALEEAKARHTGESIKNTLNDWRNNMRGMIKYSLKNIEELSSANTSPVFKGVLNYQFKRGKVTPLLSVSNISVEIKQGK